MMKSSIKFLTILFISLLFLGGAGFYFTLSSLFFFWSCVIISSGLIGGGVN